MWMPESIVRSTAERHTLIKDKRILGYFTQVAICLSFSRSEFEREKEHLFSSPKTYLPDRLAQTVAELHLQIARCAGICARYKLNLFGIRTFGVLVSTRNAKNRSRG